MGQADPPRVAGAAIEVEPETPPRSPVSHGRRRRSPTRSFGPCRSTRTPIGRPTSRSMRADDVVALPVVLVRAVAEVQPEHISPGLEQAADDLRAGARRAEGGDDLGVAMTAHVMSRPARPPSFGSGDEDGAEVVDVGQGWPGDDLVAERLEEAVAVVVGERALALIPRRGSTRQACPASTIGAGDLFGPVHAVGVGRPARRRPASRPARRRETSRNSTLRPPRPLPRP